MRRVVAVFLVALCIHDVVLVNVYRKLFRNQFIVIPHLVYNTATRRK